jgi:hypothetical protein
MDLAEQRRQHVRVVQVEIVTGAIKIGRHRADEVLSILPRVGLAELDARYLGQRIRLIGRLERAGQQRILRDRLRRELRVNA